MSRLSFKLLSALFLLSVLLHSAQAQTDTYHLHKEASATTGLFQLKTAAPDGTSLASQSAALRNVAAGDYLIKAFDTQAGVPGAAGTIPAGSTITFSLWMKKSTTSGTMFPRAILRLNTAAGTLLATGTGTTALTSTLAKYTFSATTASNISMTAADRFYVWVGVNLTAAPTTNTTAELDIEGTSGGNYDSTVTAPRPVSANIVSLTPTAGSTGTAVTITGSNFGATQGTSTVTFNGTAASVSSWGSSTIVATVPAGATTGPVVVTVNGSPSNGVNFSVGSPGTLAGTITRALDGSPIAGAQVNALQGGVTKGTATSGTDGSYTLGGLSAGSYDVSVSASGFQAQTRTAQTIVAQATTTANFALDAVSFTYIYDEAGRLVGVVDPNGDTATYNYDAAGNLTSISRKNSALVSIVEFTPNNGAVGTVVTIFGSGFGATPAQNTVKFNGVTAAVQSATTTQIVTTVPAGATTGTISVISPAGTATSSAAFTVGSATAPTITGFTPTVGAAGATVTISGTNFQTTPSSNKVAFNGVRAIINTATATSLTAVVPTGAGSGRITVTTVNGKATSADDFYIPPAPYTGTDVSSTGRIAFGETKTVSIATASKVAMLLFDGAAGQKASIKLFNDNIPGYTYVNIYRPDGTQLNSGWVSQNGTGFFDAMALPTDGTYTIIVDPENTNTGSLSLTLYDATDVSAGTITPGGAAVTATTTTPGQNARLTFAGTAGQRVSLSISAVTIGGSYISILKPDGTQLGYVYSGTGGAFYDTQTLPVDGTYTILLDPSDTNTGSATLQLYDVPADGTAPIQAGGVPVTVSTTVPGQNAALTFTGTYGQRLSLSLSADTTPGYTYVYLIRPDGIQVTYTWVYQNGTGFIDALALPMPGVYTVLVNPEGAYTGSLTLQLNSVSDATATITPDGPPVTVSTNVQGQNARLTFDGVEGQRVSLNVTASTTQGSYVTILNPDGSALSQSVYYGTGGTFVEPRTLPTSGTFTVFVDPQGTYTGSATFTLYTVPADAVGTITPGGPPVTVTAAAPGQNPRLTFTGTYGQRVSLSLSADTIPSYSYVYLLRPDGSQVTNTYVYQNGTGLIDTQTLSMPGTYTVMVDPQGANTGNLSLQLNDVSDVNTTITPDGAPITATTTSAGQNIKVTFNATAGQRVSLSLTGITIPGSYVSILGPDGAAVMSNQYIGTGSAFYDARTLPANGTYTIFVDPQGTNTGSITLQLYNVPADNVGTITPGGPPVTVTAAAPGHNPRLTFSGTYGQRVSLSLSADTVPGTTYVYLLRPDGSQVTYVGIGQNGTALMDTQMLSTTGTYTILFDPQGANVGSVTAQLNDATDVSAGTITPGGAAVTVSTTTAGQNARLTFTGTAGQRVSLNVTGVTNPGSNVTILNPDGSVLSPAVGYGTGGVFVEPRTLPTTGTYSIYIDPWGGNTGSATFTLYDVPADPSATIVNNGTPVTMTTTAPGQNARVTFTGTYGQRVSLNLSSVTNPGAYVSLLRPDGSQQTYVYTGTGGAFMDGQTLTATGTFTLFIDPQGTNTGSMTLTLYDATDNTGTTITPGGAPVTVSTTTAGQNARVTFTGTVGQRVSLNLTNVTVNGAYVSLLNPDGAQLSYVYTGTGGAFLDTQLLPANGTYTLFIDPQGTNTGGMTLQLYNVPSDATGTITPGGSPVTVNATTPGQNPRLTFAANAGQKVSLSLSADTIPSYSYVYLLKPDGSQVTNTYVYQNGTGSIATQTLPVDGTYTIMVDPQGTNTGSMTVGLNNDGTTTVTPPLADVTATITPGGAPVTVTIPTANQNGRVTFSGSYGQRVSLNLTNVSINGAYVSLLRPDGSQQTYVYTGTGGAFMDGQTLTSTGTYTLFIDPQGTVTGSMTLTLYNAPDVNAGTITPGGATVSATTTVPGQNARVTFTGAANQRVSLNLTGVTNPGAYVSLLQPDGTQQTYVYTGTGGAFMDTQVLPGAGTYTLFIDPQGMNTGGMTLQLYNVPGDGTGTITPGGTSVPLNLTTPGQNARLTFTGTYGQRVSVGLSSVTINGAYVSLLRPDGSQQTYVYTGTGGAFMDAQALSMPGTYTIFVDPQGTNTGALTVQLYSVTDGSGSTITPGGAPVTVSTTTAGQNALVTFAGTAGQRVSLNLSGVTNPGAYVYLLNPDGAQLSYVYTGTGGAFLDTQTLPGTGTYTILVDPQGTNTGSMTLTLYNVPADNVGTITPGGAPVTVNATIPGHNPRLTFNGTYGQRVSVSLSAVTINGAYVSLWRPDGTQQTYTYVSQGGTGLIDMQTLSMPGTYTVMVDPQGTATGALTIQLNDLSDVAATMAADGSPVTVTTTLAGQNAKVTFSGTEGQRVSLDISGVTIPGTYVYLLNPDGAQQAYVYSGTGGAFLDTQTLPTTGTYTIFVDPSSTYTGSATLRLYTVPADAAGGITPGGAPVTVTAAAPGHNPRVTFTGTYGQRVSLNLSGVTINGSYVSLLRPDGTQQTNIYMGTGSAFMDTQALSMPGTYTILVDPQGAGTGDLTLTLNDATEVDGGALALNGATATATTNVSGQNARFTFDGTAGQAVTVHLTNNTMGYVYVYLLNPDGTQLTRYDTSAGSFDLPTQTLPTSGTFIIRVDPYDANKGSISASVTSP
ncbi:MAG: hypothetical protein QOH49_547 [Acidobacteriota bacterium]|jgi:YD repeat-containing protein|nr:hypothetical protein [Acidobacteriota bacterium]